MEPPPVVDDVSKPSRKGKHLIQYPSFLKRGMLVSFRNITYTVTNEADKKEQISLLQNVSGYLRPGELIALMGPSGSGKTTLLDVLAGRKTVGSISGEILFGGVKPSKMFLRRFTGYVEQFDTLVPILTVEEMLRYTAELKFEVTVPAEDKAKAVEHIIDTLALDTCRSTLIGSPSHRGISGGQAKRVNIGISLISSPSVLFLDEPTSGLDSYTSNEVMTAVKNLATSGITICATIHSPTPYCFSLFDRMLLLLRGRVVYFGRNGPDAIDYLHATSGDIATTVAFSHKNPADWITDVTVVGDRTGQAGRLADAYEKSELKTHAEQELDIQLKETVDLPPETAAALAVKKETTTPTMHAFKILVQYRMMKNYQSFEFYASRAFPWIFQTIILVTVFLRIAVTVDPSNVTNIVAIIFFFCMSPIFSAASYIPAIMLSRPLYFRERNDGLFRPICFLMYLIFEETVLAIPNSLVVCTAMWFGIALQGSWFLWWISFFMTWLVGVSSAYFIAAMSPNMDVANALVPIYGVFCMFFAGFLIRLDSMGWWWRWYAYCNPVLYPISAQIRNFFRDGRDIEFIQGQTVTEYYGVNWLPMWGFFGMQLIFPTVFLTLAWAALAYKTTVKR